MKLLLLFPLFTVIMTQAQKKDNADMAALKALNARFINNFVTNDSASHSKIIHKDFTVINSDGTRTGRKQYLIEWATDYSDAIIYTDFRNQDIKIFGNTALVSSVTKNVTIKDGKESTRFNIYTDVYIKEKDEWKCIQAQLTPLTGAIPPDNTIVKKYIKGKLQ